MCLYAPNGPDFGKGVEEKYQTFSRWIDAWVLTLQSISINHFYRVVAFARQKTFHESKYINCWKQNRTTWTNRMNKCLMLEIKESMNYVRCSVWRIVRRVFVRVCVRLCGEWWALHFRSSKLFISHESHSSNMQGSISIHIIFSSVWPASFNACLFSDNRDAWMNIIRWYERYTV